MSKEKAKEFVLAHWRNEPDEALERKMKEAQSDDERLALYVEAAAGWDLTAADIRAALDELDAERKAKTQESVQDLQALEDDDVENVAGGIYWYYSTKTREIRKEGCRHDFRDADCMVEDACHGLSTVYYDCEGTYFAAKCSWGDYIENGTNKGCYKVFP